MARFAEFGIVSCKTSIDGKQTISAKARALILDSYKAQNEDSGLVLSHLCGNARCIERKHISFESVKANMHRKACHNYITKWEATTRRYRVKPLQGAYSVKGLQKLIQHEITPIKTSLKLECDGHGFGKICFTHFGDGTKYYEKLLIDWNLTKYAIALKRN